MEQNKIIELTVNPEVVTRKWPRVEAYQNTTLRCTPHGDFPEFCASKLGRAKILRTFVTLDEVWDYKKDEFDWDYDIGVNKHEGDPDFAPYDWSLGRSFGTKYMEYMTSYAAQADELIYNFRRYEREVVEGLLSFDKYEKAVETVIEHYKELFPNIVYIECCNEVEYLCFGGLEIKEYYEFYKRAYAIVNRLNKKHNYEKPLKVGGYAMSGCIDSWSRWFEFLRCYAEDTNPEKRIDFYSMHDYDPDIYRIADFVMRHKEAVRNLGIPDAVILFDEYGIPMVGGNPLVGNPADNIKNATRIITGINLSSHLDRTHVFPWCTFHNPLRQISFTQFIQREDGSYAPTPNGNAMTAFHMLAENEIEIVENTKYTTVATADDKYIKILISNPDEEVKNYKITINNLNSYSLKYQNYRCTDELNNCLTGDKSLSDFIPTEEGYLTSPRRDELTYRITLEPHSFILTVIEK